MCFWQGKQLKQTVVEMKNASITAMQARDDSQRKSRAYVYQSDIKTEISLYTQNNSNPPVMLINKFFALIRWESSGITTAIDCEMWTSFGIVLATNPSPPNLVKGKNPINIWLGPKQGIDSGSVPIERDMLIHVLRKKLAAIYGDVRNIETSFPSRMKLFDTLRFGLRLSWTLIRAIL